MFRALTYLLVIISQTKSVTQEISLLQLLKAEVDIQEKRVDLEISAAVSNCAMRPTVTANPATLYKKHFIEILKSHTFFQDGKLFAIFI